MVMVPQLANASPTGRRASKRKAKEEVERRASKGRKIRWGRLERVDRGWFNGDIYGTCWFCGDFIVIYGDLMVILWELWIVNGYLLRMAWRLSQSLSNVANPSKNLEHLEGLLLHPFLANGDAWNWVCRYRPIEKLQNFMAARPKAILEGQGTGNGNSPWKMEVFSMVKSSKIHWSDYQRVFWSWSWWEGWEFNASARRGGSEWKCL